MDCRFRRSGSANVMSNAPFGYCYITIHHGGGEARFETIPKQVTVVRVNG